MPCSPLWIFALLLLLAPLAVFVNLLPLLRQRKLLKGVRNYDAGLHRFLFRIDMTPEEFWNRLRRPNAADVLEYDLRGDAPSSPSGATRGGCPAGCVRKRMTLISFYVLKRHSIRLSRREALNFMLTPSGFRSLAPFLWIFDSLSAAHSGGAARYFKSFHITKQILNSPTCADRHP